MTSRRRPFGKQENGKKIHLFIFLQIVDFDCNKWLLETICAAMSAACRLAGSVHVCMWL